MIILFLSPLTVVPLLMLRLVLSLFGGARR